MGPKQRLATLVTLSLIALGTGVGVATAGGGDDDGDVSVTGADADRAIRAALGYTKGGQANSVERDSEKGATWEVEVKRTDGSQVDVRLDENYRLVVIDPDSENG